MFKTILSLTALLAIPTFAADPVAISNAGFEDWYGFSPAANDTRTPKLATGQLPSNWSAAQVTIDAEKTDLNVTVAKDETVKHGGKASVRIENASTHEVGELTHDFLKLQGGSKYLIKFWVKGENITLHTKNAMGITVVANTGPIATFGADQKRRLLKVNAITKNTFDWQQVELPLDVEAGAEQLNLRLQLRGASGKAWFDDVEIVPAP